MTDIIQRPDLDVVELSNTELTTAVRVIEKILNRWDLEILGPAWFVEEWLEDALQEAENRSLIRNGKWVV